jgi:chromate reductase
MTSPETLKILGISGSLRKASLNTQLLRASQKLLPEGMELEIFDLSPLPMYNSDLEKEYFPEAVEKFRNAIYATDALLITAPEYNYSITGALKNAIDWASRKPLPDRQGPSPLDQKPAAIMGVAGRMGTSRSQLHLRQIASHVNMLVVQKPEVFVTNFPNKAFTDTGDLADPNSVKFVTELLVALEAWTLWVNRKG